VGQWHPDGSLEIIDRIKNLVKLSHGEYIALESLESRFKDSQYVDNICVFGDSHESFLVSLVVPSKSRLTDWAIKNQIPNVDHWEELCKNRKVRDEVLASISQVAKDSKMKRIELPEDVWLCSEEWTPQNEMLTAAMKLKRAYVCQVMKKEISQMYQECALKTQA